MQEEYEEYIKAADNPQHSGSGNSVQSLAPSSA
jgi:hypothetical protein